MMAKVWFCGLVLLGMLVGACGPMVVTAPARLTPTVSLRPVVVTQTVAARAVSTSTVTVVPSATLPAASPTVATPTLAPSVTPTASPLPVVAVLRGVVLAEKVSCRYGPGAMYLYLYGMLKGATQDVVGRTDTGAWVLTRSRGDNKSCWVKAEFMQLDGDVMGLEVVYPDKFHLIESNQGYRSPWNVAATRSGDQVTISWESEPLRAGDEESATSVLYVVETWVCQAGRLVFVPTGAYTAQVTVKDEQGCAEPSHGRVFFSEKHGYAGPSEVPWPGW